MTSRVCCTDSAAEAKDNQNDSRGGVKGLFLVVHDFIAPPLSHPVLPEKHP